MMHELTLAKISTWFWATVPVIAGSIYAFISSDRELDRKKSWATFIIGTFIAFTLSKAVIEYFHIEALSYFAYSIQVISGLFMIQTIQEIFKQIPKLFEAIRVKWFGS